MTRPIAWLARVLRCTEGQAYSLLIGLLIATSLAIGGVRAAEHSHTTTTPTTAPGPANGGVNP